MVLGINATLITLTNGTTANAPDVLTDLQNINNGGISNDGVTTTDGSGNITATGFHATNGSGLVSFLATSYLLLNGVTINSGSTNTYTCTGGSTGVPSGATGVLLSFYFSSPTAGAFLIVKPQGATVSENSNYPLFGTVQVANATVCGFGLIELKAANGQIDINAQGGNCTIHASIYGYIY